MNEYINFLIQWINEHPHWAGIVVFLINLSESLLVVGLFVPGTIVMFGIGALVAIGAMGLWVTLLWAVLGALVGDGISYIIGRHYREHLRVMWPFNKHPEWMESAEQFFIRHGSKSVIFGRFVGPVRPLIPAVAGMMGMPTLSFYWANFISAITWAPAYILPGLVFGTSLNLASQIATRLALILSLLILIIWMTIIIVRRIYNFLQPKTQFFVIKLLAWGNAHPLLKNVTGGLFDPNHPELKGLIELGVIFLIVLWIFFTILIKEIGYSQPLELDYQVYYLLQGLRSHWADQVMVFISELNDIPVIIAVAITASIWLIIQKQWLAISHWIIAILIAILIALGLNYLVPIALPLPNIYLGEMKDYFPSIQATLISTFYGFLAVLIAKELATNLRRIPYIVVAIWIIIMIISHLYLGRRWLSDMLGGVTLGIIWSTFVGIAYRSRAYLLIKFDKSLFVLLILLLATISAYVTNQHKIQLIRYAVHRPEQTITLQNWWNYFWQKLSNYQLDWHGTDKHPLNIQIAGDISEFKNYLERYDWKEPPNFNMASILRLLLPNQVIANLPILPSSHDGQREALRLVHYKEGTNSRLVLFLWQAHVNLIPGNTPLWIGKIIYQKMIEPLGLMTIPKIDINESAITELIPALEQFKWRKVIRNSNLSDTAERNNVVLLIHIDNKLLIK